MLDDIDAQEDIVQQRKARIREERELSRGRSLLSTASSTVASSFSWPWLFFRPNRDGSFLEMSLTRSRQAKNARSSASLLGAYVDLGKQARLKRCKATDVFHVVESMIKE